MKTSLTPEQKQAIYTPRIPVRNMRTTPRPGVYLTRKQVLEIKTSHYKNISANSYNPNPKPPSRRDLHRITVAENKSKN